MNVLNELIGKIELQDWRITLKIYPVLILKVYKGWTGTNAHQYL